MKTLNRVFFDNNYIVSPIYYKHIIYKYDIIVTGTIYNNMAGQEKLLRVNKFPRRLI